MIPLLASTILRIISSSGRPQVTLRPGQSKVIQHLVPADPQKPWSWKYAVTVVRSASEIKSKG